MSPGFLPARFLQKGVSPILRHTLTVRGLHLSDFSSAARGKLPPAAGHGAQQKGSGSGHSPLVFFWEKGKPLLGSISFWGPRF